MAHAPVTCFVDAVKKAIRLQQRYGLAHVAVLTTESGEVLDAHVVHHEGCSVDDALSWADCWTINHRGARRMVILSAVEDASAVTTEQVARFQRCREVFEEPSDADGLRVVDWVLTDGRHIRSLAFTVDARPWASRRAAAGAA